MYALLLQMTPGQPQNLPSELALGDLNPWGSSGFLVGAEGEPAFEYHPKGFTKRIELKLIQPRMTQKPVLWGEVGECTCTHKHGK